jgi:hypothetical protein
MRTQAEWEQIRIRAEAALNGKSRSYVQDSKYFATILLEFLRKQDKGEIA